MDMTNNHAEQLDEAGAGIPKMEQLFLGFALRVLTRFRDVDTLKDLFLTESDRIITMAESMNEAALTQRVLIRRIRGIEDSSRDWSVIMTLEHLNLINRGILNMIKTLVDTVQTEVRLPEIKIRNLKPQEPVGEVVVDDLIDQFAFLNQEVLENLHAIPSLKPSAVHAHPWFGDLDATQWLCLMAVHMRIHRKQIEAIMLGLK